MSNDTAQQRASEMVSEALTRTPLRGEDVHVEGSLTCELPHALGCGSPQLLAQKIAHDLRRLEIMLRSSQ